MSYWNRTTVECHLKSCIRGTDFFPMNPRLLFRMGDLYYISSIRVNLRWPTLNETFLSRWPGYGSLIRSGEQTKPMIYRKGCFSNVMVQTGSVSGAAADNAAEGEGEAAEEEKPEENVIELPKGSTVFMKNRNN